MTDQDQDQDSEVQD